MVPNRSRPLGIPTNFRGHPSGPPPAASRGCFLWRRSWQIFPCVRCLRGALGGSINSGFNHPGFRDLLRASSFGGSLICESGPPGVMWVFRQWLMGGFGLLSCVVVSVRCRLGRGSGGRSPSGDVCDRIVARSGLSRPGSHGPGPSGPHGSRVPSLETALNDSAAAVPQRLPVRPTDGRIPRPAMNPVHPAHAHRAPPTRVEDRDTTDRRTGPARPWPRPRRRVRRACDRRSRPRRPLPRDAIHDDRRVGGSPPGRSMRDVAHPSHPGRGGGDAPASRPAGPEDPAPARSVPARPRGRRATGPAAATISRTTPSERPRRRLGPAPRGPGGSRRSVRTRRGTRQR